MIVLAFRFPQYSAIYHDELASVGLPRTFRRVKLVYASPYHQQPCIYTFTHKTISVTLKATLNSHLIFHDPVHELICEIGIVTNRPIIKIVLEGNVSMSLIKSD